MEARLRLRRAAAEFNKQDATDGAGEHGAPQLILVFGGSEGYMGADYMATRRCTLHSTVDVEHVLAAVKTAALVRAIGGVELPLQTWLPAPALAECSACPIGAGDVLGCYRFVHYPVDATFEQQVFAYFLAMHGECVGDYVAAADSAGRELTAAQLLQEFVVAEVDGDTPWASRRGTAEEGALASRPEPLQGALPDGSAVNSAVVLHAAFHPIDHVLTLQLYAWFYRDLFRWLKAKNVTVAPGSTLDEVRSVAELLARTAQCSSTEEVAVHVLA